MFACLFVWLVCLACLFVCYFVCLFDDLDDLDGLDDLDELDGLDGVDDPWYLLWSALVHIDLPWSAWAVSYHHRKA